MMAGRPFKVEFAYREADEVQVAWMLPVLERRVGGRRWKDLRRFRAIDVVPGLETVITFRRCKGAPAVVNRYCAGQLAGEAFARLDKRDRARITRWRDDIHRDLEPFIHRLLGVLDQIRPRITQDGQEKAVSVQVRAGTVECHIVLNHARMNATLAHALPRAMEALLTTMLEIELPDDATVTQLYFDRAQREWRYLFMPTTDSFARWVNRYVDLRDYGIRAVGSTGEFRDLFEPDPADGLKLLINPFRDEQQE
jgi:hypothetical protein